MEYLNYIEHIVNDNISDEEKDLFIYQLINNTALRRGYEKYVSIENLIKDEEEAIVSILHELTDYTLEISKTPDVDDLSDDHPSAAQIHEASELIRSVIASNRPAKPGEKKGWFMAAAVLSMLLIILNPCIMETLKSSTETSNFSTAAVMGRESDIITN